MVAVGSSFFVVEAKMEDSTWIAAHARQSNTMSYTHHPKTKQCKRRLLKCQDKLHHELVMLV